MKKGYSGSSNINPMRRTVARPTKPPKPSSLYKTKLCNNWEKTGSCSYGAKCIYIHRKKQLYQLRKQVIHSEDMSDCLSISDYSELSEIYPPIDNKYRYCLDENLNGEELFQKYKAYLDRCFPDATEILEFIQSLKEDQLSKHRQPRKEYESLSKRNELFFDKLCEEWLRYSNYSRNLEKCIDLHCQKKVEALTIIEDVLNKRPDSYLFIMGKGKVIDEEKKIYERKLYKFVKKILYYFQKLMGGDFEIEEKLELCRIKISFD